MRNGRSTWPAVAAGSCMAAAAVLTLLLALPAAAQQAPVDPYWERIFRRAQAKLQHIELHGRVEDQHGRPVPGVEIIYDAAGLYLASGSGRGIVHSDAQGNFQVRSARGVALSIADMHKPGHQYRVMDGDADAASSNPQRFAKGQWKRYTRHKPAVFLLWKADRFPALIKGAPRMYMTPGTGYAVDFLSHRSFHVTQTQHAREGDIHILLQRSATEWSVRLTGIDGGFQEQTGPYPFLAPETGYTPVLEYKFTKQEQAALSKRLYFSSRRGTVYGFLHMEISPYFSDEQAGILFWSYAVNTEKGRDLSAEP